MDGESKKTNSSCHQSEGRSRRNFVDDFYLFIDNNLRVIHAYLQPEMLNCVQEKALDLAVNGHNLCLTGQAGTGKTYTVKMIREKLKSDGKVVGITCTTGMACMQYYGSALGSTRAKTLHAWSGIHDGHFSTTQLSNLLQSNEKFAVCKDNIEKTDVLIIDEISMLSQKLFEQFEAICRSVRKTNVVFGGIQVIGVGDFYQLPPVPSPEYGDAGKFCINSEMWVLCFPHHVNLTEVVRQAEGDLIKAVSELARGEPTAETNKLMQTLSRPLQLVDNHKLVRLCARNIDVDFINDEMLSSLEGEATTYRSVDSGQAFALKKIRVQKNLTLKEGCPIMLITNLTPPLVNGLQGVVLKVTSDGPTVFFPAVGIHQTLSRFQFSIFNRKDNTMTASRKQYPIRLSYAMTIHKSQGMTLEYVALDCRGVTIPGQIAVAVGRCKSKAGLQVKNYHPALVKKPLPEIEQFYDAEEISAESEISKCCRNCVRNSSPDIDEAFSSNDPDWSDFSPLELQEAEKALYSIQPENLTASTPEELESDITQEFFKPQEVLNSLIYSNPVTEEQRAVNKHIKQINQTSEKVVQYGRIVMNKIKAEFETNCSKLESAGQAAKSHKLNKFHSAVFALFANEDLYSASRDLFHVRQLTDDMRSLCNKFMLKASTCLLKWKSSSVHETPSSQPVKVKQMSEDGKGKVRYVGGMCIAKLKYKFMNMYHNNVHSSRKSQKMIAMDCKEKVFILSKMEESYAVLVEATNYPQSLEHTQKKQNLRCSLTNISDECLELFLHIELKRAELSTSDTFNKEKENTLTFVKESLLKDEQLGKHYMDIVKEINSNEKNKTEVLNDLIERFLNVGNAEYRKQLKEKLIKKKKFAHRVVVATGGEKVATGGKEVDTKSKDTESPSTSSFEVPPATKRKVTSKKGKGTGKRLKVQEKVQNVAEIVFCPLCNKLYVDGEPWICCDICDHWYDRGCSGLVNDVVWDVMVNSEEQWVCKKCKETKTNY